MKLPPIRLSLLLCLFVAHAEASNEVYRKVAPSTVAFASKGGSAVGAGALIDVEKKLVITAHHVVDGLADENLKVRVFFPMSDKEGIITDAFVYAQAFRKNPDKLLISGRVVAIDPIKDLALVELDRLPDGVEALPLASRSPQPGDDVHVIGNSTGGRGGVFGYNRGFVRNNFFHGKSGYCFFALCHQSPTNRGDSGGPVVSDKGELLAIISHGTTGSMDVEQVVDYSVHVKEIRAFIAGKHTFKEPCALPSGLTLIFKGKAFLNEHDDRLVFQAKKGDKLQIHMAGSKTSDLDLIVDMGLDGKPFRRLARTGDTDDEKAAIDVNWSGLFRLTVRNFHHADERRVFDAKKMKAPAVTKANAYTLKLERTAAQPGLVTLMRSIPAGSSDELQLHYESAAGKARVTIIGDGRDDIDLVILDPTGKKLDASDTFEARETVTWTPTITGLYTVRVSNLGSSGNASRYFLITD